MINLIQILYDSWTGTELISLSGKWRVIKHWHWTWIELADIESGINSNILTSTELNWTAYDLVAYCSSSFALSFRAVYQTRVHSGFSCFIDFHVSMFSPLIISETIVFASIQHNDYCTVVRHRVRDQLCVHIISGGVAAIKMNNFLDDFMKVWGWFFKSVPPFQISNHQTYHLQCVTTKKKEFIYWHLQSKTWKHQHLIEISPEMHHNATH